MKITPEAIAVHLISLAVLVILVILFGPTLGPLLVPQWFVHDLNIVTQIVMLISSFSLVIYVMWRRTTKRSSKGASSRTQERYIPPSHETRQHQPRRGDIQQKPPITHRGLTPGRDDKYL